MKNKYGVEAIDALKKEDRETIPLNDDEKHLLEERINLLKLGLNEKFNLVIKNPQENLWWLKVIEFALHANSNECNKVHKEKFMKGHFFVKTTFDISLHQQVYEPLIKLLNNSKIKKN